MSELSSKTCIPCTAGVPPLKGDRLQEFVKQVHGDWVLVGEHHIRREYTFENFKDALAFTNEVGAIAESEGHHPDIHLSWGKVCIEMWTHKIDGLSESDFILAAKIDDLGGQ